MKRNFSIAVKDFCWYTSFSIIRGFGSSNLKFLLVIVLLTAPNFAQERKVDPTWLHRYVPKVNETANSMSSPSCHYRPIFGEGDSDARQMQSVARFAELTVDPNGSCQTVLHDREEDLYFVLQGSSVLQFGNEKLPMRTNDFTYLPPGAKHLITNSGQQPSQILVIGFKVPAGVATNQQPAHPKIVNLDSVKEETVSGHPSSVLYKLLAGSHNATRDAIDEGYVLISFFSMDFAPGGTNFPHHHEAAEEIYLVIDGEGEMVAGGGMDGVEGRFPAKVGDAYYFRPNCTVGFYNQNNPGAKAHILAVRSKIALPKDDD